ncbi:MAG: VWA domain-containing protein [Leptospiraceae bacterium]|nr:VWA domain-containing protein [Leptospiraceae bacterium]
MSTNEIFFLGISTIAFLIYIYRKFSDRSKVNSLIAEFPELKKAMRTSSKKVIFIRIILYSIVLIFLMLSFVNPIFDNTPPKETTNSKQGVDIVFLIDVSLSMYAVDTKPNRLTRIKDIILNILPELNGNRLGIVAFAGAPFLYCPMTSDIGAFSEFVRGMEIDMIPDTGTNIDGAFSKANQLLETGKIMRNKILVLITDGEDMKEKFPKIKEGEFFAFGVGTKEGSSIYYKDDTTGNAGYVTRQGRLVPHEDQAELVKTVLNETYLKILARKNNGSYINITENPELATKILDKIEEMEKNSVQVRQKVSERNTFIYFLIPALIALLLDITLVDFIARKNLSSN